MKKLLFILPLLILSICSLAQNFDGGILLGLNGSQLDGDGFRGYNKPGLVAGMWMQTNAMEQIFWGAELKYNQKGSRKNPTRLNPDRFTYYVNYVDLPILIGYRYQPYLSFIGGMSFNYLINSGASSYMVQKIEGFDYIDNWELGLLGGVKVDFDRIIDQSWAENFIMDVRINYSLFSIYDEQKYNFARGLYNNSISFVLYYQFNAKNQ
jgi:hypothetical protein